VDFIDEKTYEITRKKMNVPITHTDGCGMILPTVSNKNFMIRMPWVKGLLVVFPFDKFIQENGCTGIVEDIYGVKHDVLKENIQVIFTKSQFKLYSYYKSWEEYKDNFIKYNCEAATCNVEPSYFKDANINYQMLQTLTDMTNNELKKISEKTNSNIKNIGSDKKTMLKALGLTKENEDKSHLQKAIEKYPPLLKDKYTKEIIRCIKKAMVNDAWAGKLKIDGKYTFISPDLYAFCEYLFMGNVNPKGLLNDGEVFCKFYQDVNRLDCLRSPHLSLDHGFRHNVVDDEKSKWFTTNAIYISCNDLLSKLLQCDFDGDTALVVADKTIVDVAERNMKDVVPLFYNMAKAGKSEINSNNIFNGLKLAYSGGNIGIYSNNISKIWNSETPKLDVIKLLCMENNFVIDYAKCLYKPKRPKEIHELISNCTKVKLPHFFRYAKDKEINQVEKINKSTVNRLRKIIKNKNINFEDFISQEFDYTNLMYDEKVGVKSDDAEAIIKLYKKLDIRKQFIMSDSNETHNNYSVIYSNIRNEILSLFKDITYVVDVLVKQLYYYQNSRFKTTLWNCFGDVLLRNIEMNINIKYKYCDICGDIIEETINNKKYCNECAKEIDREKARDRMKKLRCSKRHYPQTTTNTTSIN
jgi:arsenate reductase-like glutaredoxin family protein